MTDVIAGMDEDAASVAARLAPAIATARAELEAAEYQWQQVTAEVEARCAKLPRNLRRCGLRQWNKNARRRFEAWAEERRRRIAEAERASAIGFMPTIHAEAANLLADLFEETPP